MTDIQIATVCGRHKVLEDTNVREFTPGLALAAAVDGRCLGITRPGSRSIANGADIMTLRAAWSDRLSRNQELLKPALRSA